MKNETCPLCKQPNDLSVRAQHAFERIVRAARTSSVELQKLNKRRKYAKGWKEMQEKK